MELWRILIELVNLLRGACSRQRAFFWMVVVLIGFIIKFDFDGVTSLARGAALLPNYYTCMLNIFYSSAVDLDKLKKLWIKLILTKFTSVVRVNGRLLIIGDGIKVAKEGKKMPGVKMLHQDSENNSKASFIMGHSAQVVSLLVKGLCGYISVPLTAEIHEGFNFNTKKKLTLLDKMFDMLMRLELAEPFYFIADKYYCSGRFLKQVIAAGHHVVTMMKRNATGYFPAELKLTGSGRRKIYGKSVKLFSLFDLPDIKFISAPMPNDPAVIVEYCVFKLLWKPLGALAQFILVKHPDKGKGIVMTTDLLMAPLDAIGCYGIRFKIENMFKQAVHQIGMFMYHFWIKQMAPTKRYKKERIWQFAPKEFKAKVLKKLKAYHLFMQLGCIAQGLMQYLAIHHTQTVWNYFGSWLRTIRKNVVPSEKVVSMAMSKTYFAFLADVQTESIFKKFIRKRIVLGQMPDCNIENNLAA